ncbi:MAG: helix-turn-helix transcriptional regulator [Pseudolabrys sp.]
MYDILDSATPEQVLRDDRAGDSCFTTASAERLQRLQFAACVRMGRAALGWSQCDLARHLGMTQRAINRLELGHTEPRRSTALAIEAIMREAGVALECGDDTISVTVTTVPAARATEQ